MSLDQPAPFVKHQTTSQDRFLGGRITVKQPLTGFRAGLDSVLLGAAVPEGADTLLDLGSGVGTASLVALAHHPALHATLLETNPVLLPLAQDNLAANGFADRATILKGDATAFSQERETFGLAANAFDVVIANPPFFGASQGTLAPDAQRALARHMPAQALLRWLKTAAGCARAGGTAIVIYPAAGLADLLAAFGGRFGAITVLPLSPRPDAPATRLLVRGRKGSRAPLTLLATRALHGPDHRDFTPPFAAILQGRERLRW